jgi:hypothetical protein
MGSLSEVNFTIHIPDIVCRFYIRLILIYRRLKYGYAFRKIPLSQGKFAIVDPADYEHLKSFKWFEKKSKHTFYAYRTQSVKENQICQRNLLMHRLITSAPPDMQVDHINHNGLDNRKANLRVVSSTQNCWNKRKLSGKFSSRYKGVSWNKNYKKWEACLTCNKVKTILGYFDNEIAAARAYDVKAKTLFKEYAVLNFTEN